MLLARVPVRLPAQEPPHRFDQQGAHVLVAMPIDGAKALHPARAMLAGTTASVTAHRFAPSKTPPIAYLPVDQRYRQGTQAGGNFFLRYQRLDLLTQSLQVPFSRPDLFHHRAKLPTHKLAALRREPFPLARPGPTRLECLVLMFDAQRPPVIFQPAQLFFPKLTLSPQLPALSLSLRRNPNGAQLILVPVQVA